MRKALYLLLLLALCLTVPTLAEGPVQVFGLQFTPDTQIADFGDTLVTDFDALMAALDQLPQLQEVHLYESDVPVEQMARLTERYPDVFFGFTIKISEHTIRTDQTAFSTLHNNKSPTHSSADFDPIRYCTRLQGLDLGHNKITDISFIAGLKDLRILILAANAIEDISPLKELPNLEYVELFKNRIRDVSPLSGMQHLLDLNLAYNLTKDLSPIESIKTLERLWIYNSNNYNAEDKIKRDVLNSLKAALPDCHINSTTYSTGGGWREHPRYFVIFDVFKNSVYKPFEPMTEKWSPK